MFNSRYRSLQFLVTRQFWQSSSMMEHQLVNLDVSLLLFFLPFFLFNLTVFFVHAFLLEEVPLYLVASLMRDSGLINARS